MKRTLRGMLVLLLLAGPAAALTLEIPFKTVSAASAVSEAMTIVSCDIGKDFLMLSIPGKSEQQSFFLFVAPTRFIFREDRDETIVQLYFGHIVNKDVLAVDEVFDLADAKLKYPNPCTFLFPEGA